MCVCAKGQMAFEFYWISFLYKFPSIFFHFISFCFVTFIVLYGFTAFLFLLHALTVSNLVRSTFCPVVLAVLVVLVQYARLYRIIYESPIRYKLFTSYTTKYRHRYTDTTWMVVMVSVCALDSYHLCASLFLALPVLRTELDSYGKVWLGFDTDLRKYIKCTHFNIPMYASKLNLYTKLHIYWILPNTFVCYVMYGTISQTLVNIRCLLCSGSAAILTFIFNGHRQSYKIHFQLASLHSSCVCGCVAVVLYWIDIL